MSGNLANIISNVYYKTCQIFDHRCNLFAMHDVGCPLTFCLVLAIGSCLVTANPYTNELEEVAAAAEKRGWNNFHAGYGKRAWNSFNAGYGKRAYDYVSLSLIKLLKLVIA